MKHSFTRTGLSVAIAALLATHGALAQEAPQDAGKGQQATPQDAPKTLDSVVVKSEYIPEPLM